MDFADTFNELTQHLDGTFWTLKGFVAFPELDGFQQQDTGMKTLPIEFVNQTGDDDYGFRGEIYFPTSYPNGDGGRLHLHITFDA